MEKPYIYDRVCSKMLNNFRVLDKNKDKTDIELIIEYYLPNTNRYCKENNLEISEFSIRKIGLRQYEILIYF